MPALYPVIGLDPWKSEPEIAQRAARRARVRFFLRNFAEGLFWGLMAAAVIALALDLCGIIP